MRKKFEIFLIRLAAKILDRNVQRSVFISRDDNNKIFEFEFELRSIAKRMDGDYEEIPKWDKTIYKATIVK